MIRNAAINDRDRVIELLRDSRIGAGFNDQSGITGFIFPFDQEYAARLFLRYINRPRMLCIVNDVDGISQGVLMAHAFEHDFGNVWLAQERVWWIDPSYRGSSAIKMLDVYENWAKGEGCRFIGMAGMGKDPVVAALYQRRGYRVAETHYLKSIGDA